jgi:uncharacterized tellurite resistance protein B-like protein
VGLATFASIKKIFGSTVSTDAEREELFKEALFMTLSRATSSDVKIRRVEVEAVQKIMQSVAESEVSAADVRVAAASELYEKAPLDRYLAVVGRQLDPEQRATIARSLAKVVNIDERVSPNEVDFYNWVVSALGATPAEIAGLLDES